METKFTSRPAVGGADYWAIHRLLIDTVRRAPLGLNWDMRRWEGRRFYDANPGGDPDWRQNVQLWETGGGQMAGAVVGDGPGWAFLQVDPDYRRLEPEMLAWAESHVAGPMQDEDGEQLHIFAYEYDVARGELLADLGYEKMSYGGVIRHLHFGEVALAPPQIAPGYTIRHMRPEEGADPGRLADLLNAAFGRDFHNAAEYRWFTRAAPGYRQYLDLGAFADDGALAAYVGVPYNDVNRRGIFEPVCAHPDHRRRGLAQALMREALLRLEKMGAVDATVETGDAAPANALYGSIGFMRTEKGYYWRKLF